MIISWNIRGLNKIAKIREISSHLYRLKCSIAVLIETRVKKETSGKVRDKLGGNWSYLDNFDQHLKGRILDHVEYAID